MPPREKYRSLRYLVPIGAVAGALIGWSSPSDARITSIVIDSTAPVTGAAIPYQTIQGTDIRRA